MGILCPSTAHCPLYGTLSPLQPSVPLKPYIPSLALCPPPQYSVLSMSLCLLYGPLSPMALSSLYGTLFNLYGPLSSFRPSILSTALYPLYDPLFPQKPSVLSQPLSPLWPPVSSKALCRRVRIVYRGLGRAFVVHKNRDLEENNFFAALGLCMLVTSSQDGVAVFL